MDGAVEPELLADADDVLRLRIVAGDDRRPGLRASGGSSMNTASPTTAITGMVARMR